MTRVLAIDPGPVQSAFLQLADGELVYAGFGIWPNEALLTSIGLGNIAINVLVIEQVEGFGMAVGREVFETVHWAGRFHQAALPTTVAMVTRKAVKLHLCGNLRAKDPNIRQALIDRFGGPASIRKGGPLYGVSKDVWSALALAVTYADGAA